MVFPIKNFKIKGLKRTIVYDCQIKTYHWSQNVVAIKRIIKITTQKSKKP